MSDRVGGSEIDSFWKPKRRIPHKNVSRGMGGGKRDNQVPGIFYEKTTLVAFEFWVSSLFFL